MLNMPPEWQRSGHAGVVYLVTALIFVCLCMSGTVSAAVGQVDLELPQEAQEAIDNGVTLVFETRYASTDKILFMSFRRQQHNHHFVIKRHVLSNRYIVKKDDLETPHIFRSIPAAMNFIAAQALVLLEFYHDEQQPIQMRLALDKFSLPGPMRLNAFIADAWDIDTGWVKWDP